MKLNQCGFVTNYLISGPRAVDLTDDCDSGHDKALQEGCNNQLEYEQYLRRVTATYRHERPEGEIRLGGLSAIAMPWEYYYSFGNWFVDKSSFYSTLQRVELDAVTELYVDQTMEVTGIFWTYAAITVWCNDEIVCITESPVYKPIRKKTVKLKLKKGCNQIYIKVRTLGVRDTRTLFGIQIAGNCDRIRVGLPDRAGTDPLYELEQWLAGISMEHSVLHFPAPAPAGSLIGYDNRSPDYGDKGKRTVWVPVAGQDEVLLDQTKAGVIHIRAGTEGQSLTRTVENIEAQIPSYTNVTGYEENRRMIFQRIADTMSLSRGDKFGFAIANILARKALDQETARDRQLLAETLDQIESRYDCSDFLLCGLIRYIKYYPLPDGLELRTREVLLNYRYWMDQKGADAMCFWSENHSLMFYTCAMNAGELYPDEYFPRAEKYGRELYEEGRKRVLSWLADVEAHGFEEFLSTVYMCVTFAALLNVIDFSEPEIACRAELVTDTMLRMLARQTFDGSVLAPMGRVYREVIHPFRQGAQALMNLINPQVPYSYGEGWLGFYATSRYRLPEDLKELMEGETEELYSTGNALICLNKKREYCMTSVQSPRQDKGFRRWQNLTLDAGADTATCDYTKSLNERFHGTTCFEPGVYGYQQHMWYAALGNETNVFTNHPGASCEDSQMRPGFWYGNGVMPAITQKGNHIGIVYHIPKEYPLHFTHAYFPAVKFDEAVTEEHWLFGRKGDGYLALWCSRKLETAADWLYGCEFRSYGDDIAYYCHCDKAAGYAGMAEFIRAAKACGPIFDEPAKTMRAAGLTVTYEACEDHTQYI